MAARQFLRRPQFSLAIVAIFSMPDQTTGQIRLLQGPLAEAATNTATVPKYKPRLVLVDGSAVTASKVSPQVSAVACNFQNQTEV